MEKIMKPVKSYTKLFRDALKNQNFYEFEEIAHRYSRKLTDMYLSKQFVGHNQYPTMDTYGIRELCKIFCTTDTRAYESLTRHVQFTRYSDLSDGNECHDVITRK